MIRAMVCWFFVTGFLCSGLWANTPAEDHRWHQAILANAVHDPCPDVRSAVAFLTARGILSSESALPSAPSSRSDCTILVRQRVLDTSLAREILAAHLAEQPVRDLSLQFVPGGIRAQGTVKGPLFINPRFQAFVGVRTSGRNRIDIVIERAAVLGVDLKRFTGLVVRSVEATLNERFGEAYRLEDLGRQADGTYLLRCTIVPAAFVPMVGDHAYLDRVSFTEGFAEFGISLH